MQTKILLFTLCVMTGFCVGQISYPENETNDNKKPQGHNRQPITSDKCAEGELLYPGDNVGDWACDCRPAFLYYPKTSKCYAAYSQGPCRLNEILILPKSKVIPICERNQCGTGKVLYNNICSKLDSHDSCQQPSANVRTHRLFVNATTMELGCSLLLPSRQPDLVNEDQKLYEGDDCFLGGKRSQEGVCH